MAITLSSKIIDEYGVLVAGATVELWEIGAVAATASTTTDAAGVWEFTGVDAAKHWRVVAAGIGTQKREVFGNTKTQVAELAVSTALTLPNGAVVDSTGIPPTALASYGGPGARVYHSVDQSISNNLATLLNWNTVDYDDDTMHSAAALTKLTATTAGRYRVSATVTFESGVTGTREMFIRCGGVTISGAAVGANPVAGRSIEIMAEIERYVAAGQYF